MHVPLTMEGTGRGTQLFNDLIGSQAGLAIQTICPVLLLLGLFTRIAAVPLLIQALALHGPDGPLAIDLYWAVLLGWITVLGPGPLSFDVLLSRSVDSSAVPGVQRLGATFGWMTRTLGPWYRLLVRLWVATACLGVALAALGWSSAMRTGVIAPWLAHVPDMIAKIPPGLSLAIAVLLILGLATRIATLTLLTLVPFSQIATSFDDLLYWTFILAIFLLRGPGPFALDRLLDRTVSEIDRRRLGPDSRLPHVVIIGGGFGGIAAAQHLNGAPCRITLVDQRNYHLFQPLLYQVATAGLSPADIATPIRSLFRTQANISVLLAEARGVATGSREVMTDRGGIKYDYLVLATGSQHSYFGRDEWAATAPGLKRIEDATEIRRRLLIAFERAENAADSAERSGWMSFVVVGGGPTGVELAGAIAELALHGLKHEFRVIDPTMAKVILIQSAARLLPTFPEVLSADAEASLRRLGVDVRLGSKVEHMDGAGVVVTGEKIAARTVLWAAGVAASPAGAWLDAPSDKVGRLMVGPDLSVTPRENIFAIGDTAASTGWKGKPVPGLAPAAKQGGQHAARVIRARLMGRPPPKPFSYRHAGSLATIGRQAAVAEFGPLRFRDTLAWWIWGVAHIVFLVGGRNRAMVMLSWAWAYFTYRRGIRLITDGQAMP